MAFFAPVCESKHLCGTEVVRPFLSEEKNAKVGAVGDQDTCFSGGVFPLEYPCSMTYLQV